MFRLIRTEKEANSCLGKLLVLLLLMVFQCGIWILKSTAETTPCRSFILLDFSTSLEFPHFEKFVKL